LENLIKVSLLLILTCFLPIVTITMAQYPSFDEYELEYRVNVGDTQTYEIKKFYRADGDYTPDEMIDENGEKFNVSIREGTRLKVIITSINKSDDDIRKQSVHSKLEFSGRRTLETNRTYYVFFTTDNRTYWEELLNGSDYYFEGNVVTTISDDKHMIYEQKINIKTGWLVSIYLKEFFDNGTLLQEQLFESVLSGGFLDVPIRILNSIPLELVGLAIVLFGVGGIYKSLTLFKEQSSLKRSSKIKKDFQEKTDFIPQSPHTDIIKNIDTLIDELEE
jgi:hypothetical protein